MEAALEAANDEVVDVEVALMPTLVVLMVWFRERVTCEAPQWSNRCVSLGTGFRRGCKRCSTTWITLRGREPRSGTGISRHSAPWLLDLALTLILMLTRNWLRPWRQGIDRGGTGRKKQAPARSDRREGRGHQPAEGNRRPHGPPEGSQHLTPHLASKIAMPARVVSSLNLRYAGCGRALGCGCTDGEG